MCSTTGDEYPIEPTKEENELDKYVYMWIEGRPKEYRQAYKDALFHYAGWLQETETHVRTVSREVAIRYVRSLAIDNEYAVSTVKKRVSIISSFYTYLCENGVEIFHPFRQIFRDPQVKTVMRGSPRKGVSLSAQELTKVFAASDTLFSEDASEWLKMALSMMAFMGLRLAEIAGAKIAGKWIGGVRLGDFFYTNEKLAVSLIGKGSKPRTLMVDEYTKSLLLKKSARTGDTKEKVYPFGRSHLQKCIRRIVKHTGIHFSAHDLRRTCATQAWFSNVNMNTIKDQLGHADIKVTERYLMSTGRSNEKNSVSLHSDLCKRVMEEMKENGHEA